MNEMIAWMRGVIEGDLERAKAIPDDFRQWRIDSEGDVRPAAGNAYVAVGPWGGGIEDEYAEHIITHDPRDTIARCEAELEIIDDFARMTANPDLHRNQAMFLQWNRARMLIERLARGVPHRDGWKDTWT